MKIINIVWDTDGDEEVLATLPMEVVIDNAIDVDSIADYLSDEYEFCVKSFQIKEGPLDITREAIKRGYKKGCVWLGNSPHEDGVVCFIGDMPNGANHNWFYFGGRTAEGYTDVVKYLKDIPENTIIDEIFEAVQDIGRNLDMDEYDFYKAILTEYGCFNTPYEDIKEVRKEAYRLYQLDWMMRQGYSLNDIFEICREGAVEMAIDGTMDPDMNGAMNQIEDYYEEQGFNGSMYVCFNEFLENEYLTRLYIVGLLSKSYGGTKMIDAYLNDPDVRENGCD